MFGQERKALTEAIADLKRTVADLRIEREAEERAGGLAKDASRLRQEVENLKVEKSRLTEGHEREKREVEHLVGLQKRRGEWEASKAAEEARLEVQKGNLTAEQARFEKEMDFMRGRMETEISSLREMYAAVLERLPTVTVDLEKSVRFGNNGHEKAEALDG